MENFLDSLRKNWIFITLIASIIIWSANLTTRIETAEAEILELKSVNKEYLNTLQQIQVDIAIIRTKLDRIDR